MGKHYHLKTKSDLVYHFYPVESDSVVIRVRAKNNAQIVLAETTHSEQVIEVVLGGWGNTKSAIRRNKTKPEKCKVRTPKILDKSTYRGFVIDWRDGTISVRIEDEEEPFMLWTDCEPFPIKYIGVCTGYRASGRWRIKFPSDDDDDDESTKSLSSTSSLEESTAVSNQIGFCLLEGLKYLIRVLSKIFLKI